MIGRMMLDQGALAAIYDTPLDWRFKAIPASAYGLTLRQWLDGRPEIGELGTPLMTLDADALAHNISAMAAWCARSGLAHAPHGKTTMAPQLWQRQLEAGAEAVTVANAPQLRVARAFGVPRVLVANELVSLSALEWLADWVNEGAEVTSFVDSVAAVSRMDSAAGNRGSRLDVCLELGGAGGRAGVRDLASALEVAAAVKAAPRLRLVGVSGYEGSLAHSGDDDSLKVVDDFLERIAGLYDALDFDTDAPIVTAGGSEFFDQVADHLVRLAGNGTRAVLRAGSYVTHDDGLYASMTPRSRARSGPELRAALRVHATVLSMPEPGLALLDVGRRDVSFDSGFPVPLDHSGASIVDLNDQHAHLRGEVGELRVGDVLRLGISHPCTAFDKWNLIPVADGRGTVVDAIMTYF